MVKCLFPIHTDSCFSTLLMMNTETCHPLIKLQNCPFVSIHCHLVSGSILANRKQLLRATCVTCWQEVRALKKLSLLINKCKSFNCSYMYLYSNDKYTSILSTVSLYAREYGTCNALYLLAVTNNFYWNLLKLLTKWLLYLYVYDVISSVCWFFDNRCGRAEYL